MTLIFAVGNSDQVIQFSDRRLSGGGKVLSEEANKAAVIISPHARLVLGFTGLARVGRLDIFHWLTGQLVASAGPDFDISDVINRFVTRISESFASHAQLKHLRSSSKELSLMLSGYIYVDGKPTIVYCVISNAFDCANGWSFEAVQDSFNVCFYQHSGSSQNPVFLQRIGNWRGVETEDEDRLRDAASRHLPASAIVEIGVNVMSSIAKRAKSSGTIGLQVSSISVPSDPSLDAQSNYHSAVVKPETFMPAIVYLLPHTQMTVHNIALKPVGMDSLPLSVPKVKRSAPCPCGSKRRYRHCHGRWK